MERIIDTEYDGSVDEAEAFEVLIPTDPAWGECIHGPYAGRCPECAMDRRFIDDFPPDEDESEAEE